jgi:uncharacterized membrane protein
VSRVRGVQAAIAAAIAALSVAAPARAQSVCTFNAGVTPVYVAGPGDVEGSAGPQALAQALVDSNASPSLAVVYVHVPTCTAIQSLVTRAQLPVDAVVLNPHAAPSPCVPAPFPPDFVISDVFAETCAANLATPTQDMLTASRLAVKDFWGAVQPETFVVPRGSPELAISADAAYVVFGFAAMNPGVVPWIDPAGILAPKRPSGPLNLVASAIGLAPSHWATAAHSNVGALSAMVSTLLTQAPPGSAIGIMPAGAAEANHGGLRILAYQHTGQQCGYLPSSDANHFDRINVRQGRYALWGQVHVLMSVDITGKVVDRTGARSPGLARLATLLAADSPQGMTLTGQSSPADSGASVDASGGGGDGGDGGGDGGLGDVLGDDIERALVQSETLSGLIPECAMQVTRSSEMGPEASYEPAKPCGCYYETLNGASTTSCMPCTVNTDCSAAQPVCRLGFCEAQ